MTDRHAGYIVTLTEDVREDDTDAIINALRMINGVASVEPLISDWRVHVATQRAREEIRHKVLQFVDAVFERPTPKENP